MNKFLPFLIAGMGLMSIPGATAQNVDVTRLDARMTRGMYKPGEVIVKFKASEKVEVTTRGSNAISLAGSDKMNKTLQKIGLKQVDTLMPLTGNEVISHKVKSFNGKEINIKPMKNAYLLKIDTEAMSVEEAVKMLGELSEVEYAEPNYLVFALEATGEKPDDPYYDLQYGLQDINLPALWAEPVISKDGPIIAILDTGVDITHPDLAANIWTNYSEANGATGYDDDRNGFIDDIHGWDFVNQTGNIVDYNGHGTHCAGIAAACGFNNVGIVGANPDARIMPLTVMQSNGQGDMATIIKALDYAAANGADIISMSLGSYSTSMAFEDALGRAYSKAVIISATGNDGLCMNHAHPDKGQLAPMPMYPAAYNFVLGVQATKTDGGLASFSNYDDNGPTFSEYGEEQLYNYELQVPGVSIMSTYPGGGYKELNGTSMATPLVAGAVSRLLQCKEYINKEELFGDLINSKTGKGNLDIYATFNIQEGDRKPEIQFVTLDMVDSDGDGRADAGEVVEFYPVIRNSWGNAKNIKFNVECAETVNNTFEILQGEADFGLNLSSYGKAKSLNPVKIKFNDDVVDGRIVRLKFTAQADNAKEIEQEFEVMVENAVELTGILKEDMTLTPDKHYVVTGTFGVPTGITLTIQPGTTIKFRDKSTFTVRGKLIANGEKNNLIKFTKADLDLGEIYPIDFGSNNLTYCIFNGFKFLSDGYVSSRIRCNGTISHSIIEDMVSGVHLLNAATKIENCLLHNLKSTNYGLLNATQIYNSNLVNSINNSWSPIDEGILGEYFNSSNVFNNYFVNLQVYYSFHTKSSLIVYTPKMPNYVGSGDINIAHNNVIDINHPLSAQAFTNTEYDLSNMLTQPDAEAPGIVWKVVVNDLYDAQDDFSAMPPLGVGTHKFDVYFNRPMNKEVTPLIAMGVRPPYTSVGISERGSWNDKGDIYTAHLTINGKSSYDGLNRIYVSGAEDNEFFPIPVEDSRFNVLVQAAGSLSSGFEAEAGLGRVNLKWDNTEENFDDMLGLNMYRYEIGNDGVAGDTICVNQKLLEPKVTELTDYDVTPRKTYGYFYKVMRTDLAETSPSKTVAITPLTASIGDANGSGDVDVADVITTVNYISGLDPKPFIFEAADMNTDEKIDILDIVSIIRNILNPTASSSMFVESTATYFIDKDGVLYVDCPVDLAGVQLNLELSKDGAIVGTDALNGFEKTGAWLDDSEYVFMAYNLSGKTIPAGKTPIAMIKGGEILKLTLSDADGHNVTVTRGQDEGTTGVAVIGSKVSQSKRGIFTLSGVKLSNDIKDIVNLPSGIYVVNGEKVVK